MPGPAFDNRNFFTQLTLLVCRYRWVSMALLVFVTAFFVWQMQGLVFDNSKDIWFVEGDPSLERIQRFESTFGNDDFIYLVFDSDKAFTASPLRRIGELARELERTVPYVKDVTWLGNAEHIESQNDSIVINDFFDPEIVTDQDVPEIKRKALAEKMYRNSLVADDAGTFGLVMEMGTYPGPGSVGKRCLQGPRTVYGGAARSSQRLQHSLPFRISFVFRALPAYSDGVALRTCQRVAWRSRTAGSGVFQRGVDHGHDPRAWLYSQPVYHPCSNAARLHWNRGFHAYHLSVQSGSGQGGFGPGGHDAGCG